MPISSSMPHRSGVGSVRTNQDLSSVRDLQSVRGVIRFRASYFRGTWCSRRPREAGRRAIGNERYTEWHPGCTAAPAGAPDAVFPRTFGNSRRGIARECLALPRPSRRWPRSALISVGAAGAVRFDLPPPGLDFRPDVEGAYGALPPVFAVNLEGM